MSAKWSSQVIGKTGTDFGELLKDEYAVILLQGKNVFGDMIYCYLKVGLHEINKLNAALNGDTSFNISDYGTVVAAGKGLPTEEVKAEIAITYPMLAQPKVMKLPAAETPAKPEEKKNWDEY